MHARTCIRHIFGIFGAVPERGLGGESFIKTPLMADWLRVPPVRDHW